MNTSTWRMLKEKINFQQTLLWPFRLYSLLWFGIGGNQGRRVTLPFCSDDVDDVQSFDFAVGHDLSKKVTNEHFYMKNVKRKIGFQQTLLWPFRLCFHLWFGIGGNQNRWVSLPFCSDDVDDVPSFAFAVGHDLSKKVTNEHFYMKNVKRKNQLSTNPFVAVSPLFSFVVWDWWQSE